MSALAGGIGADRDEALLGINISPSDAECFLFSRSSQR